MDRNGLLRQMQQDRQELQNMLNGIPEDKKADPLLPNGWSFKDFLGHLGFWEKRALEIFHYFREESVPDPKPGSLSLDEINAWAYAANRDLSLDTVLTNEREAFQALIKLVESAADDELFDPQHFSLADGKPFVNWIEDNTFGHFQEHLPDLRAALNLPGWIHYIVGSQTVRAYTAHAPQGGPGVVVLHAWWGLNAFFQRLCDRLAAQGYTVLAPDLFAGKLADTIDQAGELAQSSDSTFIKTAVLSAVERLRQQPGVRPGPVGVIGFSFGAAWALVLSAAQPEELAAAVLFYGAYEVNFKQSGAAFQGHFADNDEYEPIDGVRSMEEAMKAAGRETDFNFYPGTGHWFFEDDRPDAYHAQAARLAWERTLTFLKAKIGG